MIVLAALAVAVVLIVVGRRRRKATLAGRDSTKPVYSIEPPSRSVRVRRTETL